MGVPCPYTWSEVYPRPPSPPPRPRSDDHSRPLVLSSQWLGLVRVFMSPPFSCAKAGGHGESNDCSTTQGRENEAKRAAEPSYRGADAPAPFCTNGAMTSVVFAAEALERTAFRFRRTTGAT